MSDVLAAKGDVIAAERTVGDRHAIIVVGRTLMAMRGSPASGSMMRISCGGRNTRSKLRNRGAKSVILTERALIVGQHGRDDGCVALIVRLQS